MRVLSAFILSIFISVVAFAQTTSSLRGQVVDPNGAIVPNAVVTATNNQGVEKTVVTNNQGEYTITNLPAGIYTVRVNAATFGRYENTEVKIEAGKREELIVTLTVEIAQETVIVGEDNGRVTTEPDNNADATVLRGADLESLPEDPDELAAALQALAGASAGPNGGQFYIDGFTGGRIPPREAIREVRINQNPFSAEFDRLGFGRIEILTKPGADKIRGQAVFNFGDESFNSRNPFALNRPSSQIRNYGGNLSGPIQKGKSSFFFDFNRREADDNANVNAQTLDSNLNVISFQQALLTPRRRLSFSPRFDYAINERNTLVVRYTFERDSFENLGLNELTLPTRAYDNRENEHTFQITETAILSPTVINETRFQFIRERSTSEGDNSIPAIFASPDFIGGGAQIGLSFNNEDRFELQNYTTWSRGKHSLKAGIRVRSVNITDRSESNFTGTYTFIPTSEVRDSAGNIIQAEISAVEKYRQRILNNSDVRFAPSQFSITAGDPLADVSQTDVGVFLTDDWRVRPDLTLSFGLRYENQTNISSNFNLAPRFGFAYSPGAGGARPPQTVIRGGFGIFYERFNESLTLNAIRLDGTRQQQYTLSDRISDPTALAFLRQANFSLNGVTNVPTAAELTGLSQTSNIRLVSNDLQSPYTMQGIVSIERQVPFVRGTVSATYIAAKTNNLLRTRNQNAPNCLPLQPCSSAVGLPDPTRGRIDVYESTATSTQHQLIVSFNTRLNPRFSVFSNYRLGSAQSDSDGAGSYPAYSTDLSGEFSRSSFDVRHNFIFGGSFTAPWKVRLNPFIIASSGRPFNITTGVDTNRDTLFTERPAFATDLNRQCNFGTAGLPFIRNCVVQTEYGNFDLQPTAGQEIIPRNYGVGPAFFNVNLNVNKTFGFGQSRAAAAQQQSGQPAGGQPGIPGIGGGGRGGGGGGGGGGGRGGQGGGGFGGFGTGGSDRPYNLTVGLQIQNLLNRTNLSTPIGNLSSGRFGDSLSTVQGFGFGGGGGGNFGNRRIELQLRFSF